MESTNKIFQSWRQMIRERQDIVIPLLMTGFLMLMAWVIPGEMPNLRTLAGIGAAVWCGFMAAGLTFRFLAGQWPLQSEEEEDCDE